MTLTDVGTRYNGMELSPERVAAFFIASPPASLTPTSLTPNPSPLGEGLVVRLAGGDYFRRRVIVLSIFF